MWKDYTRARKQSTPRDKKHEKGCASTRRWHLAAPEQDGEDKEVVLIHSEEGWVTLQKERVMIKAHVLTRVTAWEGVQEK